MSGTVLLAEPSVPVAAALRRYLESAGYVVRHAAQLEDAVARSREEAPDLVFAAASGGLNGEALCQQLKGLHPTTPVVLIYPPEEDQADAHAAAAGADAALVGPLKRGTVVSCARLLLQSRSLKETVERLEGDLRKHIAEPPADVGQISGSSADFEFFKKYLLMEVKRSRRYRYPVAFLLVALDHFAEHAAALEQQARMEILGEALSVITRGIRDIDLAIPSGENRFLIFLPHTPRAGALFVASRLQDRLGRLTLMAGATVSVGVAAYEPSSTASGVDAQIGFGVLMREVTEALARALAAGGNRVEASGEKKKPDRISLA